MQIDCWATINEAQKRQSSSEDRKMERERESNRRRGAKSKRFTGVEKQVNFVYFGIMSI